MTAKKGYRVAIEYIALNDEPGEMADEVMEGFPSVQALAVAFGKPVPIVATAVVDAREKLQKWDERKGEYYIGITQ